jgi:hypothetical protein
MDDIEGSLAHEKPASLTHESMRDLIVTHLIGNLDHYIPEGVSDKAAHMRKTVELLDELCVTVAQLSVANRVNVSMAEVLGTRVPSDPENDVSGAECELRYRLIEQIGGNAPISKNVYSYEDALTKFGEAFVNDYWGTLGEHCPKCVTSKTEDGSERKLWFSVIRVPVATDEVKLSQSTQFKAPGL